MSKRSEQVARKTIRIATKVKYFQQKYKTTDGKNFNIHTPNTAWVQAFGKQPILLGNSAVGFVTNPFFYGPC